ncbi:MAG: alpha/beta fold hydrolase [Pyrinomonadaceae bacterium]
MEMNHIRRGAGRPLLLIHGLGGTWRSWSPVLDGLASEREVIAVDLPGFGETPPLPGEVSIRTLADAVTEFLAAHDLTGVDAVGSSMGARLVLELARRGGVLGAVVSLDPGGFWRGWQRHFFYGSIWMSIRLVRALQPVMPSITGSAAGRTLLFPQFSPRPWRLSPQVTLDEMRSYAASPSLDELLYQLAYGETQEGAPPGSIEHPLVIGWGRRDRVCFPSQARRALKLFPDARLHWFGHCGHFPHWDVPQETTRLILTSTSGRTTAREVSANATSSGVRPSVRPAYSTGFDQSFQET